MFVEPGDPLSRDSVAGPGGRDRHVDARESRGVARLLLPGPDGRDAGLPSRPAAVRPGANAAT